MTGQRPGLDKAMGVTAVWDGSDARVAQAAVRKAYPLIAAAVLAEAEKRVWAATKPGDRVATHALMALRAELTS